MNSISYERDRLREAVRKDRLDHYDRRSISPRVLVQREPHSTVLERQTITLTE